MDVTDASGKARNISTAHAIVGTAGHVDHGKTALIRALTGVETDRLPEERARGISIELGFAPLRLPSGRTVGVVDVPGHERFVHHMVAGAAGMDVVILVVAADEGVMPQTREHLDVLSLLGLRLGVVALTKVDLVDRELVQLVAEEVRALLQGTFLGEARIIPVSSLTGEGLSQLLAEIDRLLSLAPARDASGPVRLPIDRVFTMPGFGTVVTGTVVSGSVAVGDQVELLPPGLSARVRQVQVHGQRVEQAQAGQRAALNLVGVDRGQVERGQVVCAPRAFAPARQLTARFRLLASAPPMLSGTRVHVHLGTAEVSGRVVLLDREEMPPGADALIRLGLEEDLVASRGDRFVVRAWSPLRTIGGGMVLSERMRPRRYSRAHLASLEALEKGGPAAEVWARLQEGDLLHTVADLVRAAGLSAAGVESALEDLQGRGRAVAVGGEWWAAADRLSRAREMAATLVQDYHRSYPGRWGMPREELRQRLGIRDARAFAALLETWARTGFLVVRPGEAGPASGTAAGVEKLTWPGFRPGGAGPLGRARAFVKERLRRARFTPPGPRELVQEAVQAVEVGGVSPRPADVDDLLQAMVEDGELVRVSADLYLEAGVYREGETLVREFLARNGSMTAAQFRDLLATTRKFAIPLLEYLDRARVTRRVGDLRVPYTISTG